MYTTTTNCPSHCPCTCPSHLPPVPLTTCPSLHYLSSPICASHHYLSLSPPAPLTTCPSHHHLSSPTCPSLHYLSLSPPAPLTISCPHALSLKSSVLTTCTTNCPSHHRSSPVLDHLSTPVAAICSHLAYVIRRPLYLSLLSVHISPSSVYPHRTPSVTHSLLSFYHLFPPSLHNLSPPSVPTICPHMSPPAPPSVST
ncbi:hypothetical protein Pcinc_035747 [Petrolisthes cinctipes]|uniref:Uncharacterized protein n=1 Tax=Petrolisthes cinctipes TaxID=88211 RepID=A0AAE1BVX8_PETCI|nr:hypothetical protein Pcinc_035747 [Petrolisthes cinctipes]